MIIVLLAALLVVCFFQLLYLVYSRGVEVGPARSPRSPGTIGDKVCVLIPVFNCASTLAECLGSLLRNDLTAVSRVIVVLDRCTDGSSEIACAYEGRFRASGVAFSLLELPGGRSGKVAAIEYGGSEVDTARVLLVDADIVLTDTAVAELLAFQASTGDPFCSCLIFPFQTQGTRSTLAQHVVCNNRLYRQAVVQSVKSVCGVANFPGGVHLVDFTQYSLLLEDGFLEDLTATYRILDTGGRVAILPRVLAHEVERQTIRGLFLQRTRWTIGALQHLRTQVRTARSQPTLERKIFVSSYHVMWEFQHYAIVLGLGACTVLPRYWVLLTFPLVLYVLQIFRSVFLSRKEYRNSPLGVALHCLIFSWIISAALIGAVALLVKNRRAYFESDVLFRRSREPVREVSELRRTES